MFDSIIQRLFQKNLVSYYENRLRELDPNKTYLLVLSNDIPLEDIHTLKATLKDKIKLYIVQSDNVRFMEFS